MVSRVSRGTHPEELAPVDVEDAKELAGMLEVAATEVLLEAG
jgi:hypothetical protein